MTTHFALLLRAVDCESLVTRYEQRYSCDERELAYRCNLRSLKFESSVKAAATRHYSDCFREFTVLTGFKRKDVVYGRRYTVTDGALDDLRNEGHESRIAMALAGLPVYTKEGGEHE